MKILYLSCHSILEYDELRLFNEIGYQFFSMGSYINPNIPHDVKRPPIMTPFTSELDHLISVGTRYSKDNLHPELIEPFDVIIVMHVTDWISTNWKKFAGKKVIWRSIGQSNKNVEETLSPYRNYGLKIVRYSPKEKLIPKYQGENAIIRFYKDPVEFYNWNGEVDGVITIAQSMKKRGDWCGFKIFDEVTRGFHRHLFGPDNEDTGIPGGILPYEMMKSALRDHRVYFYTGTYPSSYTLNFIEAMMTGIPIVAIGPKLANLGLFEGESAYEVPDIIQNGVNGFISDDLKELQDYIKMLMKDYQLANKIGQAGRETAIKMFGKEVVKQQWKTYLESL